MLRSAIAQAGSPGTVLASSAVGAGKPIHLPSSAPCHGSLRASLPHCFRRRPPSGCGCDAPEETARHRGRLWCGAVETPPLISLMSAGCCAVVDCCTPDPVVCIMRGRDRPCCTQGCSNISADITIDHISPKVLQSKTRLSSLAARIRARERERWHQRLPINPPYCGQPEEQIKIFTAKDKARHRFFRIQDSSIPPDCSPTSCYYYLGQLLRRPHWSHTLRLQYLTETGMQLRPIRQPESDGYGAEPREDNLLHSSAYSVHCSNVCHQ
ncbi:hypothetical protein BCR34DRAFT_68432 [Clohesyomyces aquaticus]|uniref:Uncharacterized protein n=1 Tax=Clohesyomyces aquaticus TaxID=1231657 RepID=A0A1Y1Z027_9PLEO|nr:hypothetical protein BCR34DRAFT_68432 [Clohesyomyces aquaticus]